MYTFIESGPLKNFIQINNYGQIKEKCIVLHHSHHMIEIDIKYFLLVYF